MPSGQIKLSLQIKLCLFKSCLLDTYLAYWSNHAYRNWSNHAYWSKHYGSNRAYWSTYALMVKSYQLVKSYQCIKSSLLMKSCLLVKAARSENVTMKLQQKSQQSCDCDYVNLSVSIQNAADWVHNYASISSVPFRLRGAMWSGYDCQWSAVQQCGQRWQMTGQRPDLAPTTGDKYTTVKPQCNSNFFYSVIHSCITVKPVE